METLYERIALPGDLADRLRAAVEAAVAARQARSDPERKRLERQLAKAESQRRKLLDAYYGGTIDIDLLREEQRRLGDELASLDQRLATLDADTSEWSAVLETALRFATDCGAAYRAASQRVPRRFNHAVFERLEIWYGRSRRSSTHAPLRRAPWRARFQVTTSGGPDVPVLELGVDPVGARCGDAMSE